MTWHTLILAVLWGAAVGLFGAAVTALAILLFGDPNEAP